MTCWMISLVSGSCWILNITSLGIVIFSSAVFIGLVSDVPQWMSRVRGMLGRGVWRALHSVRSSDFFLNKRLISQCKLVQWTLFVLRYEKEGRAKRVVKAQQLWYAVIESQTETGTPYILYKDACNRKSNQQNLGTIKSSNLCTEIVEYTSKDEVRG